MRFRSPFRIAAQVFGSVSPSLMIKRCSSTFLSFEGKGYFLARRKKIRTGRVPGDAHARTVRARGFGKACAALFGSVAALLIGTVHPVHSDTISSGGPPTPVTLYEAVQKALVRRPDLKAQDFRVKSAEQRIHEAKSTYYPQISANYQNIYGNSLFGYFLFPGYQYGDLQLLTFTLSQTLYDFGRTGSFVAQNRWNFKVEKSREAETRESTIRDVEVDYFRLLSAQHQVESDTKSLEDAQTHLDESEARFREGTGVILDVTRARVNVESARLALIRSKNDARSASIDLARVMGVGRAVRFVARDIDRDPNRVDPLEPQKDLPEALSRRPEMQEAANQVKSAESFLDNARSQNYPTLSGLVQSFTAIIPKNTLPLPYAPNNYPYSTFNFGGSLNIPIVEGGFLVHQMDQARADLGASIETRRDTRLRVISDIKKAVLEIRDAKQRIVEARSELANAEKNDALVEEAYRVGSVHSVDVMDAQTALREAREAFIQAKYALMTGYADYQYARGTLEPPPPR